jgi:hypothetical protein
MADHDEIIPRDYVVENIQAEIELASPSRRRRIFEAVAVAALGSIPWVGGVIAAASMAIDKYKSGEEAAEKEGLLQEWLQQHQEKLQLLRATLEGMVSRLEGLGSEIEERITSDDYLTLVRKTFRAWDVADTEEKRRLLVNLITNAAGTRVAEDDIVRLFLDWINTYHDSHFAVIREIYKHRNDPPTRYDIWVAIYGEPVPADNSPQADLFRMLVSDLNIGRVIRLPRETDPQGRFKKRARSPRRVASPTLESAFEDSKQWVLTGLGSQFVHYTMNELVQRIGGAAAGDSA